MSQDFKNNAELMENKMVTSKYLKFCGIGVTIDENGEAISYGKPISTNIERFHPDHEMCSEIEIAMHELCLKYELQCKKTKELLEKLKSKEIEVEARNEG